jgi:hypothetical protein
MNEYDVELMQALTTEEVLNLLKRPEITPYGISQALVQAAYQGHMDILNILLADQKITPYGVTYALVQAAYQGHMDILNILLADQKITPYGVNQALEAAAYQGHMDILNILLADQRTTPYGVNQALKEAANQGHMDILKTLLADQRIDRNGVHDALINYAHSPLSWPVITCDVIVGKIMDILKFFNNPTHILNSAVVEFMQEYTLPYSLVHCYQENMGNQFDQKMPNILELLNNKVQNDKLYQNLFKLVSKDEDLRLPTKKSYHIISVLINKLEMLFPFHSEISEFFKIFCTFPKIVHFLAQYLDEKSYGNLLCASKLVTNLINNGRKILKFYDCEKNEEEYFDCINPPESEQNNKATKGDENYEQKYYTREELEKALIKFFSYFDNLINDPELLREIIKENSIIEAKKWYNMESYQIDIFPRNEVCTARTANDTSKNGFKQVIELVIADPISTNILLQKLEGVKNLIINFSSDDSTYSTCAFNQLGEEVSDLNWGSLEWFF